MYIILQKNHNPELLFNTVKQESCLSSTSLLFNSLCSIKLKGKLNADSSPIFLSAALRAVCTVVRLNDLLSKILKVCCSDLTVQ